VLKRGGTISAFSFPCLLHFPFLAPFFALSSSTNLAREFGKRCNSVVVPQLWQLVKSGGTIPLTPKSKGIGVLPVPPCPSKMTPMFTTADELHTWTHESSHESCIEVQFTSFTSQFEVMLQYAVVIRKKTKNRQQTQLGLNNDQNWMTVNKMLSR